MGEGGREKNGKTGGRRFNYYLTTRQARVPGRREDDMKDEEGKGDRKGGHVESPPDEPT